MGRRSATLLSAAVLLAISSPAAAHNGVGAAFKGPAGPYTVYAYDGYAVPGGLSYRLVVIERTSGEPAQDVEADVSAHPLRAATPRRQAQVDVMNNVVFYDLPNPYPGDWLVTVRLHGSKGSGLATFAMHGQAPYVPAIPTVVGAHDSTNVVVVAVGSAAAALAVVAVSAWWLYRRHRRRSFGTVMFGRGRRF